MKISHSQAIDLEIKLNKSIYSRDWSVLGDILYQWRLNPSYYMINTNMAYNIGEGSLNNFSKLRKAIQAGDYEEAGVQMASSKWAGQVKGRSTRLVARMTDNTSGTQLASLQTEGGNLQASSGGGGGNVTINKGGDNTNTQSFQVATNMRDDAVKTHTGA